MDPVDNAWCNFTYLGPTDDIGDLRVQRDVVDGRRVVRSFWKPTPDELEQLQRGATIVLGIYGMEPIPPVSLHIEFSPDDLDIDGEPDALLKRVGPEPGRERFG